MPTFDFLGRGNIHPASYSMEFRIQSADLQLGGIAQSLSRSDYAVEILGALRVAQVSGPFLNSMCLLVCRLCRLPCAHFIPRKTLKRSYLPRARRHLMKKHSISGRNTDNDTNTDINIVLDLDLDKTTSFTL